MTLVTSLKNTLDQLLYYGTLRVEASSRLPDDPDNRWPIDGNVKFENVSLRYRPNLPLVLKGVSFEIRSGEKVSDL